MQFKFGVKIMKKEKVISLITAILMATAIFGGCGGNNSEESGNNSDNIQNTQTVSEFSENTTPESSRDNSTESNGSNEKSTTDSSTESNINSDKNQLGSSASENENNPDTSGNTSHGQSNQQQTNQQQTNQQQTNQQQTNQQQTNQQQTNQQQTNQQQTNQQQTNQQQTNQQQTNQQQTNQQQTNQQQTNQQQTNQQQTNQQTPSKAPEIEPNEISLSTYSVKLKIGETKNLNTTVLPKNASDRSYSYYIDDASVIDYLNGVVKAKNPGTATISFKTVNGITASCKVTVYGDPTGIELNQTGIILNKGDTYTLSATTDIGNYNISYKWNSNNTDVATVSSTDYSTAVITAKAPGTSVITVKTSNGVSTTCKVTVKPVKNETSENYEEYRDRVIELVNNERTSRGLPTLKKRNDLFPLAQTRAKEICGHFEHTRPDGRSCFTIFDDNNIQYSAVGENIAYGQTTPEEAVKDWMNSQGHRENILSKDFSGIGIGCYKYNGVLHWVQLFIHE